MRWFRLPTDGTFDLADSNIGEVSIAMKGTGTAVLGYLDVNGVFTAYIDAEATLTNGMTVVCASGIGTNLQVQITGAAADTAVGVAQMR